jgi:hypothetical protein
MCHQIANVSLSLEFGPAVNVDRLWYIVFNIGFGLLTVENVIGTQVDHGDPSLPAGKCDITRSLRVHLNRELRPAFAFVNSSEGRSVDHNVWLALLNGLHHRRRIGDVSIAAGQREEIMLR